MTTPADLVLTGGEVHTLTEPDAVHEAVAIRDGEIVRVDSDYEIQFLTGVETTVIDCEGRVVLPGFVDAHTHLESQGQYLVHADLSAAEGVEDAIERLRAAPTAYDWIRGFGYDESEWPSGRYLTREDLDRVSEDRPVVAMRVDMHLASLNSVALDRVLADMPPADVHRDESGTPTGVVVEDATEAVWDAIEPDPDETRELVRAAIDHATARGVTGVHEKVRHSHAPRIYRDLAADDDLDVRVRLDYWSHHLQAVLELGLATNSGGDLVRVGGIKSFTDGSFGGRTAKLFEPYADAPAGAEPADVDTDGELDDDHTEAEVNAPHETDAVEQNETSHEGSRGDDSGNRGQWVVDPPKLREIAERADAAGLQLTVHAIGDEAIAETIDVFEDLEDPGASRHRIEHAELPHDDHVERMAEAGIVASMQPNFLQWAGDGGLYDQRLGEERRRRTNRFRTMLDAGVPLAFGSDCMPLDPLLGVHHAVNAPDEAQRLTVTEALRAYTRGAAYAGFDEDRLGTIEPGKRADIVILEDSPWERPAEIEDIAVYRTILDGRVVYDGGGIEA